MTKISFDVDFTKDPEQILKEIQERAKAEVEKRESKERSASYLSNLHESVNEKIGTEFKSVGDLIRALTPFAAPSLRDKLSGTTSSGRRKTLSMSKDIYEDIKKLLAGTDPNKAAIARETGASVVQVRKVAEGGFDSKYSGSSTTTPTKPDPILMSSELATPPVLEEPAADESVEEKTPASPPLKESETKIEDISPPIEDSDSGDTTDDSSLPHPSFGAEDTVAPMTPPPAPLDVLPSESPDLSPSTDNSSNEEKPSNEILPPLPKFTPAPFVSDEEGSKDEEKGDEENDILSPLPSFGDEEENSPLPPPAPLPPPTPIADEEKDSDESNEILPPLPNFTPAPFESEEDDAGDIEKSAPLPPPLPSFGEEKEGDDTPLPPPAPLSAAPPVLGLPPPVQPVEETDETGDDPEEITPSPEKDTSVPPTPPPMTPNPSSPSLTRPPSGLKPTLKPKLGGGKKGKPTLSLKPKSKTTGLKITRPPMKGSPPPPQ
jgi:hypothetical protein